MDFFNFSIPYKPTQGGYNNDWPGWASLLQEHLVGKRDVYNRGYGGLTTRQFSPMYEGIMKSIETAANHQPAITTLYLGANDAVVNNIPLEEYDAIIREFVKWHRGEYPSAKILLIAPPPPVCQCEYDNDDRGFQGQKVYVPQFGVLMRPNDRWQNRTRYYRDAVIQINADIGDSNVGLMDPWVMMFGGTGEFDRDVADSFYHDGLHYNAKGDKAHFEYLVGVVRHLWPELGF
ncbi:hypothetical protein HDU84_009542 [Entophlyctis sp. JEL0112]|nr:hypothetical protein HDU84_009542 [Entophlyctis sp. JEL0112]